MVWSLISIALVFWICKQLSAFDLKGFKALLAQFAVNLSDEADAQLKTAAEILFVTLAVYVAISLSLLNVEPGNFLNTVLAHLPLLHSMVLDTVFVALLRHCCSETPPVWSTAKPIGWVSHSIFSPAVLPDIAFGNFGN